MDDGRQRPLRSNVPIDARCRARFSQVIGHQGEAPFNVSWPTALVRLRQMNAITHDTYAELRNSVRPRSLAQSLGYEIDGDDVQGVEPSGIGRFPRSFMRMLRQAVVTEVMSPPTAAAFAGLALPEIVQILGQPLGEVEHESPRLAMEFDEFEFTGVVSGH